MAERDNSWLHAYPTNTKDAWFITLCGFDGTSEPPHASFLWPKGPDLKIPNKMVLMTVAAYADLCASIPSGQRPEPSTPEKTNS